jgi:hypothetical protein
MGETEPRFLKGGTIGDESEVRKMDVQRRLVSILDDDRIR